MSGFEAQAQDRGMREVVYLWDPEVSSEGDPKRTSALPLHVPGTLSSLHIITWMIGG